MSLLRFARERKTQLDDANGCIFTLVGEQVRVPPTASRMPVNADPGFVAIRARNCNQVFLKLCVEAGCVGRWTKYSSAHIYYGDAASHHDWEFRTRLRIRLWKENKEAKATSRKSAPSPKKKRSKDIPNRATEEDEDLPAFPEVASGDAYPGRDDLMMMMRKKKRLGCD